MIAVEGLHVVLGGTTVLDGVDMSVPPGTMLGLVGPNGAGKSSLLRAIAGLVRPAAGEVRAAGRPVRAYQPRERARLLAYLPQDTTVSFPFTAYQVTMMGRHPHLGRFAAEGAADHRAVEQAMARAGTARWADRIVPSLSGGERQLVLLGKALAQDTQVLLADEPVAALDLRHQLTVLRTLRAEADAGRTVLVVLHDLNLAARYCTALTLLAHGRVRAAGRPAAVLAADHVEAAYGVRVAVRDDDLTGSVTVTALEHSHDLAKEYPQ